MAAFIHAGTNATMATATQHMLSIGNDTGQTCAVSQLDDNNFLISTGNTQTSTNAGITIFGGTGGNAPPMTVDTPRLDPRILNKYLTASDLLESFIADVGRLGAKQGDILNIPIELFVNWLVCKAAEEDGHAAPEGLKALPSNVTPIRSDRCRCCGQFITAHRRKAGVLFCSSAHMDQYLAKSA